MVHGSVDTARFTDASEVQGFARGTVSMLGDNSLTPAPAHGWLAVTFAPQCKPTLNIASQPKNPNLVRGKGLPVEELLRLPADDAQQSPVPA